MNVSRCFEHYGTFNIYVALYVVTVVSYVHRRYWCVDEWVLTQKTRHVKSVLQKLKIAEQCIFPSTLRSLLLQAGKDISPTLAQSCGTPGKFPRLVMVDTVPKRQAVQRNQLAVYVTVII